MSNSVSKIMKIFCCFADIGHVRNFLSLLCDKLKLNLTWMLNQGFGFWLKAIGMRILSQQPSLYNLENEKSFNVFSELAHISTLAQVTEKLLSLGSWKKNDRKLLISGYDVVQWFLDRHRDQLWEGPSWPSDLSFAYSFAWNRSLRFFWPARWADPKWSGFSCCHLWDFTFHSLSPLSFPFLGLVSKQKYLESYQAALGTSWSVLWNHFQAFSHRSQREIGIFQLVRSLPRVQQGSLQVPPSWRPAWNEASYGTRHGLGCLLGAPWPVQTNLECQSSCAQLSERQ